MTLKLEDARRELHDALADCEAIRSFVDPNDHSEEREPFNKAWMQAYARALSAVKDYSAAVEARETETK